MPALPLYIVTSILAGAIGQLMMKLGVQMLSPLSAHLEALLTDMTFPPLAAMAWVTGGVLCYLLAMVLWLRVLKELPLSMAYPLLSLGYIVVYLGAYFLPTLEESLSQQKTLGIALIIMGVVVMASQPKEVTHE